MSSENENYEELNTDIAIVGGGGAGLAAAVSAFENGVKDILILEARRNPGGNAALTTGIFAVESPLQIRLGIDARKDDYFLKAMNYAHWKTNPKLIRSLVDRSGDNIRWLEKKGVKFSEIPIYPAQDNHTFHLCRGPKKMGAIFFQEFSNFCRNSGINIRTETRAVKLVTNGAGTVTGLIAENEGKEIRVNAKSVILATGGFLGNEEILKKYIPDFNKSEFNFRGIAHNGDGLLMAVEIGAAVENMAILEMRGPDFPWSPHISRFIRRPNMLWVNREGRRFTDETIVQIFPDSANTLFRQPGKTSYTLFDEETKRSVLNDGVNLLEELTTGATAWPENLDGEFTHQSEQGRVKVSDNWNDIALWMGADPDILRSSVNEYNASCERGYDAVFNKNLKYLKPVCTPPFYAAKCCINLLTTHGGIKIDEFCNVINTQEKPIRGLFAAGVETGGMDSDTYDINLPGHAFACVINTGRIAGGSAAAYALKHS